jgi:hypothetical protein
VVFSKLCHGPSASGDKGISLAPQKSARRKFHQIGNKKRASNDQPIGGGKPTSPGLTRAMPNWITYDRRPLAQNRAHVALFATMSQAIGIGRKLLYKRIAAQEESDSRMKGLGFLERKI